MVNWKVDVHHHFIPEAYRHFYAKFLTEEQLSSNQEQSSRAMLSSVNATHAIFSFPLLFLLPPDEQPSAARAANTEAANLRKSDARHFGFFASVPCLATNMTSALQEIDYAFDTLKADGILLFTSYGGKLLGDVEFAPVWEKLNLHNAVILIHPSPSRPPDPLASFHPAVLDFPHETTKTALDLLARGCLQTYADCKIILSHAGGTLPYVISRAAALLVSYPTASLTCTKTEREIIHDASKFYFDLAISSTRHTLDALTRNFPCQQILYGTDHPYCPSEVIQDLAGQLHSYELSQDEKAAIYYGNAFALFPRFADSEPEL